MFPPESWIWFAVALGAMLLFPHVIGPFLIRFTLKQQATPEVVPFPVDHPEMPEEVRAHFTTVKEQLMPEGFEVVTGLALPRQTPGVKALILLLVNRSTRDSAIATAMYCDTLTPPLQTAYVEIVSRYRDGTMVQTNNSHQLGAFLRRKGTTSTQLPSVTQADRLYRLHCLLAARISNDGGKVLRFEEEFHGDAVAYFAKALREELEAQIDTGYMFYSEREDLFRPTMKGAWLMCWALLFPIKNLRALRRARKERQLLRELKDEV